MEIIEQIKILIEKGEQKNALSLYKEHKEEIDEYIISQKYISVKGHEYTGYNHLLLSILKEPGKYGTFKQWKDEGYIVKKGEKSITIFMPIFDDKEERNIKFMKRLFIFGENQIEKIK